ncbi:MAG: LysR substrate-binding domain-containing protein [Planctomycetota bacterium]
MELTTLRQFIAIADAGHITRAAESLGVTQPALSAMLKKLEEELGSPLFDRTGRGVSLTSAGAAFLEHAEAAVRRADDAVRAVLELSGLERGVISIGGGATATAHLLPPVVRRVREAHPGLRLVMREAGSDAIARAVIAGELDLGIVTLPVSVAGRGELMTIRTLTDELRLIVPAGHRLLESDAEDRRFRWQDLTHEPVVAFEAGSAVRSVIDRAAAEHGVTLDVVMELRSIDSIRRMVDAGIGVGFISRFALDQATGLRCGSGVLSRDLAVVRRRDRVPSAAASVFERALLDQLATVDRAQS